MSEFGFQTASPPNGGAIVPGVTPIIGGAVGQILFQGAGNVIQESPNLFWDNTNGILDLSTTADNRFGLKLRSTTGQFRVKPYLNSTYGVLVESRNAADSAYLPLSLSGSRLLLLDGNVLINTTTDAGYKLDVNGAARVTNGLVINAGQRLSLGGSNYGSDALFSVGGGPLDVRGYYYTRFTKADATLGPQVIQVEGQALIKGSGNTSATTSLLVQNSASTELFIVRDDGNVGIGTSSPAYNLDVNGTSRFKNNVDIVLRGADTSWDSRILNNYEWFFKAGNYTGYINFGWGSGSALRIQQNGNVLINTTTDAGFKFDVNGTARVQSQLTVQGMTVGLGGGSNSNSVAVGLLSLASNLTGSANTSIGASSLNALTSGVANTAVGFSALSVSNGTGNTTLGSSTFRHLTSGDLNVAIGQDAGRYIADGVTQLTTANNSVFLGMLSRPLATSQTNQIVIGYNAIGAGSNTVTLGNTSIVKTILRGTLNAANLPTSPAGLSSGDIYNNLGVLMIV